MTTSFAEPAAPAVPTAPRPTRRRARTGAVVAAVAVLAGGAGGAVGAAFGGPEAAPAPAVPDATTFAASYADDVAGVAARVLPSVVSIAVQGAGGSGSGSGVVLDDEGRILTNDHVVEPGVGGALTVTFDDGRSAPARIVGRDPVTDVAVLDVDGVRDLQPIELGRSRDVRVGAPVVAIGSPLGLSGTVTTGIVSALNRTVPTSKDAPLLGAIQTDAAINPGSSGGALVDDQGRLIGINTAISTTGGGSIGLGFAIPVDEARAVADELVRTGRATHPSLGVGAVSVESGDRRGALLQSVPAGSAAGEAGLREGDLVVAVDGQEVATVEELVLALRRHGVGQGVVVTYLRDGDERLARVTLADRAV